MSKFYLYVGNNFIRVTPNILDFKETKADAAYELSESEARQLLKDLVDTFEYNALLKAKKHKPKENG